MFPDGYSAAPAWADVVVRDFSAAESLARSIARAPRAAGVVVELLRLLPALAPAAGLVAESLAYGVLQGSAEHAAWLEQRSPSRPQPPGTLHLDRAGDALSLVIDRPWAGNAIDRFLRDALAEALELAVLDPTIARIGLTARGKAFSLGADLAEFGTTRDPATAHVIRRLTLPARHALACADRLEVHVHGACVGHGLELAAWASRLTASRKAWFQLPELAMGILPGAGGCVALVRRIGRQRTAELILSGRRLSAAAALEWGLVDALVDDPAPGDGDPHIG